MTTCKTTASVGVHGNAGNKSVKKQLLWNGTGHNNYKQLQKNTKNLFGRIRPGHPTTSYPGVAQLVARLLWEREAQVRAVALGKPGKPWDTWADSTFPLAGNWSKIGVDHMFDHNWKISYPGVAQLVARLLWEQDAGSSSLPTRTKNRLTTDVLRRFL